MRTSSHSTLRRFSAVLMIPLVMLLSACGAHYNLNIHDDDTADQVLLVWDSTGTISESDCSAESMQSTTSDIPAGVDVTYTYTEYQGDPACEIKAVNVPLSSFDGSSDSVTVTHKDGVYEFTAPMGALTSDTTGSDYSIQDAYGDMEVVYAVTFPGKVTEASGNGTIDGNTVTWNAVLSETEDLHAVAEDGSGFPWLWVILGTVALLLVAGIIAAVLLNNRRKKRAAAGASAYNPGQPGYAGQPYPGQSQPGQSDYAAPQGYSQPGQAGQAGYPTTSSYGQPAQPGYPDAQGPSYGDPTPPTQGGQNPYGSNPS